MILYRFLDSGIRRPEGSTSCFVNMDSWSPDTIPWGNSSSILHRHAWRGIGSTALADVQYFVANVEVGPSAPVKYSFLEAHGTKIAISAEPCRKHRFWANETLVAILSHYVWGTKSAGLKCFQQKLPNLMIVKIPGSGGWVYRFLGHISAYIELESLGVRPRHFLCVCLFPRWFWRSASFESHWSWVVCNWEKCPSITCVHRLS